MTETKFEWNDKKERMEPKYLGNKNTENYESTFKPQEEQMAEVKEKYGPKPRKERSKPSSALSVMLGIERLMTPLSPKDREKVRFWFDNEYPYTEVETILGTGDVPES